MKSKNSMNYFSAGKVLALTIGILFWGGCKDLTELNINPNGASEEEVNPNLIMPTVLTEGAKLYLNLGYQDIAGVVQHTQKDAWAEGHNDYDWGGDQSWNAYYDVLRNNALLYKRASEENLEFHQGVALVMRAFMFGLITDLWGDAPYTDALRGDEEELTYIFPKFDTQETIYTGIIGELEQANSLLSKPSSEYAGIIGNADVYYGGEPAQWRKFANSLLLRYYMRISEKMPDVAKAGIEKIAGNPSQYPIITEAADDATLAFVGSSAADSWPNNLQFDDTGGSNYRRLKMCATLVNQLQALNDPRLAIWANRVQVSLKVDASLPAGTDRVEGNVRYLSPDKVAGVSIDQDPDYVGMPPSWSSSVPSSYNLNPTPGQLSNNPHVSFLNDMYKEASGPLLKARLLSAAEVHFILAEAAIKGWSVGNGQDHYNQGIEQSLAAWAAGNAYGDYINNAGVVYDGTIAQVMEQKWIASWTAATEAWFDYRRTGYPDLKAGPAALRRVLPVRFYYMQDELNINRQNAEQALERLEVTGYSQADDKNSAWSKPWLLQGTGKPW
ncbi:SusD/RagB family nutrient-binding outer membrane lipoprotein [Parapedobacter indicus]|uniref:Starch-binding associating with outer membrane n=1 Tax=Parapedobacter indicus TaxID=1477437 RepID=A0A1I3RQU5_9SPHI|nr:SusD/RagB family nutrient-binding outer membrane lipoprotein [Parapedobacter indicus]PPL00024.1 SusD-like starch-binding protein associating with outer membrane [Parapedobacter indicus]SFJ48695.1 Starch-binding associating with outer membrane [Parapedobacter indicus]